MIETTLLFPTPVFTTTFEVDPNVKTFLNSNEYRFVFPEYIIKYGESSTNSYVLNNDVCSKLKHFILQTAREIMMNKLSMQIDDVQLTQSWVSTKYKNQRHGIHNHPNSILSGVYYYDDYDDNSEPLILHKQDTNTSYELEVAVDYSIDNPVQYQYYYIKPKTGLMVLFPSYVRHSVDEHHDSIPRKSLAFNILPTSFGVRGGFSEMYLK